MCKVSCKFQNLNIWHFLTATKQLYEWYVLSVCLSVSLSLCPSVSVCLSVCPSHLFDYVPIIVSSRHFQELSPRTRVTSMQKVKVTEVTTELNRFRTVTPVWINTWWWNYTYSLMLLRRGALLFSRSSVKFKGHMAQTIVEFDPDWPFPGCNSSLNSPRLWNAAQSLK